MYSVVFKFEDTTLSSQTIKSGEFATAPETTTTEYKVFNGWKVNGLAVNVEEYRITADTVFVADITYKFDVKFISDGVTHNTQIVEKNGKPVAPENPTKENYSFVGWSLDGTHTVNVSDYIVTENTTFTAIFKINEYTVTFKDGNSELSTQQVQHGKFASVPENPTKNGYNFVGWSVDGSTVVAIESYTITQNTTFIAVFKQAGKPFEIGYDTLGYGSNLSVDFECTSEVLTNATVTFTLTLVDLSAEFEDYDPLKISRVVVQDEGGEDIFDLDEINGKTELNKVGEKYQFSFELPEEYAGKYITIMVYLLPLDY